MPNNTGTKKSRSQLPKPKSMDDSGTTKCIISNSRLTKSTNNKELSFFALGKLYMSFKKHR